MVWEEDGVRMCSVLSGCEAQVAHAAGNELLVVCWLN